MNQYTEIMESMDHLEYFYALPEIDQCKMASQDSTNPLAVKIVDKSFTWGVKMKTPRQLKNERRERAKKEREEKAKKNAWFKNPWAKIESTKTKCRCEKQCIEKFKCRCESQCFFDKPSV
jgi:Ni,Fe-hydrogenase I large subunit